VLADEISDVSTYAAIADDMRRGKAAAAQERARDLVARGEEAISAALKRIERADRRAS